MKLSMFLYVLLMLFWCCEGRANSLRVHFINVGYGDAAFLQFPDNSTMLIDAGEDPYRDSVKTYLEKLKVKDIDYAVITHPHINHFNSFFNILKNIHIKKLFISKSDLEVNKDTNKYRELEKLFILNAATIQELHYKDSFNISSEITLTVLHPSEIGNGINNDSLVLLLSYKDIQILFTGDIELIGQKLLLKNNLSLAKTNVIKIPHHGGPLSKDFIKIFKDKIFILSTGKNVFGLPKQEELNMLQGSLYRTDLNGTIIVETNGKDIEVKTAQ